MLWLGNRGGHAGVGVLVNEELYNKVVEGRRLNDRVMSLVIVLVVRSGECFMGICSTKLKIDG